MKSGMAIWILVLNTTRGRTPHVHFKGYFFFLTPLPVMGTKTNKDVFGGSTNLESQMKEVQEWKKQSKGDYKLKSIRAKTCEILPNRSSKFF